MKSIIRVLRSPLTLIVLFSFLIISGKSSAFFYIILVLMGISIPAIHSILGLLGMVILLSTIWLRKGQGKITFQLVGALSLIVSLVSFFLQPGADYNYDTLTEPLPLSLLILFLLVDFFFITSRLKNLLPRKNL